METAIAVYAAGETALRSPDSRLLLTVQRLALELRQGTVPEDLWDRARDLLAAADRALGREDVDAAGTRLQESFNLGFHRTLHFEDIPSPLSADPATFLAPFLDSSTFRLATTAADGRRPPMVARPRGRTDSS